MTDLERFNQYAQRGGDAECWPWRSRQKATRPVFHYQGDSMPAARASYLMHKGEIPAGMVVRHTCDNAACVNPAHLELGAPADNTQDMIERGRMRRACNRGHANTPENRYTDERGARRCRLCAEARIERERNRLTTISQGAYKP